MFDRIENSISGASLETRRRFSASTLSERRKASASGPQGRSHLTFVTPCWNISKRIRILPVATLKERRFSIHGHRAVAEPGYGRNVVNEQRPNTELSPS